MTNEEELPVPARRYQWYLGYNREDEYDKEPEWAESINTKTSESEGYAQSEVTFYDRFDPEHIWLTSDTSYNLMNCL